MKITPPPPPTPKPPVARRLCRSGEAIAAEIGCACYLEASASGDDAAMSEFLQRLAVGIVAGLRSTFAICKVSFSPAINFDGKHGGGCDAYAVISVGGEKVHGPTDPQPHATGDVTVEIPGGFD